VARVLWDISLKLAFFKGFDSLKARVQALVVWGDKLYFSHTLIIIIIIIG
jgi:hypothetical protein